MIHLRADSPPVNTALQTITAAADAIAAVDHHFPRPIAVQKRRWGSCWSLYWCFGSVKQRKRIGHAVLVPEPSPRAAAAANTSPSPENGPPLAAPPSSPASFLPSDPSSAAHSPTAAILAFTSLTANMDEPSNIYAIGPFAHEPQLVSPPLNFSTLTTEPSTAPVTPPESIHLTTPSSPEVPFAHFLHSNLHKTDSDQQSPFPHDEFQSHHFYPGSPVSHLISPRSVISRSGASSPFPDPDFASLFPNFPIDAPPMLLNLDNHGCLSIQRSNSSVTGFRSSNDFDMNPQTSESISDQHATNDCRNTQLLVDGSHKDEPAANRRFSFELYDEDTSRSVENKELESKKLAGAFPTDEPFENREENCSLGGNTSNNTEEQGKAVGGLQCHKKHPSVSLGCAKEFNFDNVNGVDSPKPKINSGWWGQ